jgi:hypothetical protein
MAMGVLTSNSKRKMRNVSTLVKSGVGMFKLFSENYYKVRLMGQNFARNLCSVH